MKKYIGVEIGGTKLQVFLGDTNMKIIRRSLINVGEIKSADIIKQKIEQVILEFLKTDNICGIGVGFGGPIDYKTGIIATSHQVKGWSGVNLKKWFEDISGLPVQVENDANTAALAEAVLGKGKTYDKVFYVTLGSGVGGGYIINKEIYHGKTPGEAEIGQMRYDKTGVTFESLCSGWAVDKKLREYVSTHPKSQLAKLVGKNNSGEAKFVVQAIEDGDTGAKAIMEETANDLAFGLSHVIHLFNPEIIILGGGLSLTGELLRQSVYSNIPKYVMKTFHPITDVQIAGLGEDVVVIGSLLLAQKISTKK